VYGLCVRAVKLSGSEIDHRPNLMSRVRDELFTLVRWLDGCLLSWSVGWLVGWLVRSFVGWMVGWLDGWLIAWLVGRLVG